MRVVRSILGFWLAGTASAFGAHDVRECPFPALLTSEYRQKARPIFHPPGKIASFYTLKDLYGKMTYDEYKTAITVAKDLADGGLIAKEGIDRQKQFHWSLFSGLNPLWNTASKKNKAQTTYDSLPEGNFTHQGRDSWKTRQWLRALGAQGPEFDAPPEAAYKSALVLASKLKSNDWDRVQSLLLRGTAFEPELFDTDKDAHPGYQPAWTRELVERLMALNGISASTTDRGGPTTPEAAEFVKLFHLRPQEAASVPIPPKLHVVHYDTYRDWLQSSGTQVLLRGMVQGQVTVAIYLARQSPFADSMDHAYRSRLATVSDPNGPSSRDDTFSTTQTPTYPELEAYRNDPKVKALATHLLRGAARAHQVNEDIAAGKRSNTASEPTTKPPAPSEEQKVAEAIQKFVEISQQARNLGLKPAETLHTWSAEDVEAAVRFNKYFEDIQARLLERDQLMVPNRRSIIGRTHLNMEGRPGTAKSMNAQGVLGKITVGDNEDFFRLQFTRETTNNDMFGPLDVKKYEQGFLARRLEKHAARARFAFFDETGNARPDSRLALNGLLNEREMNIGGQREDAPLSSAYTATNKTRFQEALLNADSTLDAYYDRIPYHVLVPDDFQFSRSAVDLIRRKVKMDHEPIDYAEVKRLQDMVDKVHVSAEAAVAAAALFREMRRATGEHHVESLEKYLKAEQKGEKPEPYYLPTRNYSPRDLTVTGDVLRTAVVDNWTQNRSRKLEVELEDLSALPYYFGLNVGDEGFIQKYRARSRDPYEKAAIDGALFEARKFNEIHQNFTRAVHNSPGWTTLNKAIDNSKAIHDASLPRSQQIQANATYRQELMKVIRMGDLNESQLEGRLHMDGDFASDAQYVGNLSAARRARGILDSLLEADKLSDHPIPPTTTAPTGPWQTPPANPDL